MKNLNAPSLDWSYYAKKVRTMTLEELHYTIKDCNEAMKALPENPKNGYYADEVHMCYDEIRRRVALKTKLNAVDIPDAHIAEFLRIVCENRVVCASVSSQL